MNWRINSDLLQHAVGAGDEIIDHLVKKRQFFSPKLPRIGRNSRQFATIRLILKVLKSPDLAVQHHAVDRRLEIPARPPLDHPASVDDERVRGTFRQGDLSTNDIVDMMRSCS